MSFSYKEIEKRVYEKYPVTKDEKKCHTEKMEMDKLRTSYRKKLKKEGTTHMPKREIK